MTSSEIPSTEERDTGSAAAGRKKVRGEGEVPGKDVARPRTELIRKVEAFLRKVRDRGFGYLAGVLRYFVERRLYRLRGSEVEAAEAAFLAAVEKAGFPAGEEGSVPRYLRSRTEPRFHFRAVEIPAIVSHVPEALKEETLRRAELAGKGTFSFRDIASLEFKGRVDWYAVPKGNMSWNWDLNRHRFFIDLALSYHYTKEEGYAVHLVELWSDWIERNPPGKGVTWDSPFEVASRLNNWLWAFFLLVESDFEFSRFSRSFLRGMFEHAAYLYRNLEYHWPNNHLFLESKVLLEYSSLFPEWDLKGRFARRARRHFVSQVERQILEDGGHSELCSMYHLIVAGELLEIVALSRKTSLPLPPRCEERMRKSIAFSRALVRADGSVPLLGDSAADDNNIRFDGARFDRTDLNYWLVPGESDRGSLIGESGPKGLLTVFPESGYAFIFDGDGKRAIDIVFDFGAFSRNPAPDHSHCDGLAFDLFADGIPVITDPGVCFPETDAPAWRRFFRGTAAHATLSIDGREQSELWRVSDVKRRAECGLVAEEVGPGAARLTAFLKPYWAGRNGIRHLRTLEYKKSDRTLIVTDEITGT